MDLKKEAAREASTLVAHKNIVGLGAGSTIAYLVNFLKQRMAEGLEMQFVTSSFTTLQLLQRNELPVLPVSSFKEIDLYFDGCDQLDRQLNALKSGGGIHTQEKLLASMAKQFVLVGDEAKLVDQFDISYPLVLEILPQALAFVPFKIAQLFTEIKSSIRIYNKKDGPVITENGNYLLDIYFEKWPELASINSSCKSVTGILETSLFYQLAHKAIIAGEQGIVVL